MGCRGSKSVEGIDSKINTVLKFDSTQLDLCNTEKKSVTLVDKIKSNRRKINVKKCSKSNNKYNWKITSKYDVKATIGEGTFTKVLRVESRNTKQPYALKLVQKIDGLPYFQNEISVLRRISHTNIIKIITVINEKGGPYGIVFELTTGGDLFDRLFDTGIFTEKDAVKVISQVLNGVQYMHSIGITHRDLKPNNVLYYQPGIISRVVITGFDLAHTRSSASDTLMNEVCGTKQYLAPEVVSQQPYTQAVDLWAVGVITFIIIRGDFPFCVTDRLAMFRAIAKAEYSLEDEVWQSKSLLCRQFVSCLMSRRGEDRPTAEGALQHPWMTAVHPSHPRVREWPGHKCDRSGLSSSSSSCSTVRSLQVLRSASFVRDAPAAPPPPLRRHLRGTRKSRRRMQHS